MFTLPLFAFLRRMAEPIFSPSILSSSRNLFALGDIICHHPLKNSKSTSDSSEEKTFDWVISFDLFPLKDSDIPTLLHCSSGSRSSPDIFFALFFLAVPCSWEVLQNLGSDHLPVLLTASLSPVFRPNRSLPSLNFQETHWDYFAFYFDSHCFFCREILVFFSFFCCCSLCFSDIECSPYDLVLCFFLFWLRRLWRTCPLLSLWR